jgi:hypothetical protein
MKLTRRKGFNFFRSYYDVYNELSDKDKVQFMDALLDRQFLGKKPTDLKGMAKFAYISQTNSIDSQVKGYEDKTGTKLGEENTPSEPPRQGEGIPPTEQVEVQVEVQEEEQVEEKEVDSVGSSNEQPQAPKRKVFKPPTLDEVFAYCQERGKGINAQQWHDHYTSNGWMVGKNKMKDWRAAVRTWERNNINNGTAKKPTGEDRMQALKNWGAD